MLLMVEKGIRAWICQAILWSAKGNNKYMKDFDKNKELLNLKYWDLNNLYGWAMSQKFPVKVSLIQSGLKMLLNLMKIA